MATRNASHPLPPRPPLTTQQSNSVPSTPHQYAKEFRSRSRSPSPHHGLSLGNHSPRSVKSEANGPLASLPKGRPTCKYETSAAFSRRRMQYDIGDAPLEKPKEAPKKTLDPHEEKKLSGDMRELYDRLLPSEESDKRRVKFVEKLERMLRQQWPDTEFNVHIFGSSGNLLCTSESDVDICIQTPMKKLETMHMLAEVLANNGMERVICIAAAKVPIVKIWDPELQLAADMNVNNTLALENTRMIKTYVQIDERVRPLAMTVKHWTKQRILNDAGIGGTLSSYAWICMILNFLQTRNPPILPALHQMPHKEYRAQDGTESGFNDDIDQLRNFGAANKETIGELLFNFFRFFAHELDYEASVISVRHGKILTRQEKGWDHTSKEGQWRLTIEEPFNTTRNLGNSADSTAFRGIHLELRQAFDHLADGVQLLKALEPYEFPPEEKFVFKKPVAGPKPTLSAAIAPVQPSTRSSRGGGGTGSMRGGRHNNSRQGTGYRRSSSGASFGRHPYPFLSSPPISINSLDYINAASSPEAIARLQEQLLHQSQVNGLHLEQLKTRYALQEQQIRAAAEQARNASFVHAHTVAGGSSKSSQGNSSGVSPQKTPHMTGNSSPSLSHSAIYPEYLYQSLGYDGQPLTQSMSHDGARTNPSSPSLANAVPRRAAQRASGLNGSVSGSGSLRSQSQPARGFPQGFMIPGLQQFPGIPGYAIPTYSVSNASQDPTTMSQSSGDASSNYENSLYRIGSLQLQPDQAPKEYVGYFVPGSTQPPNPVPQPTASLPVYGTIQQIPAYSDLAHRRNRQSQDLQLTLNGNRHASRSPSPLGGHQRTFSIPVQQSTAGLRSAPLPRLTNQQRPEHIDLPAQRVNKSHPGPPVVNGSTALPKTPETVFTTSDEEASTAGDNSGASFFSKADVFAHGDALGLSGMQPHHAGGDLGRQNYSPGNASRSLHPADEGSRRNDQPTPSYSPPQAFPPYMDAAPSKLSALAHQHQDQLSPKTLQSPWSGTVTLGSKPSIPHLDTVKAAQLQGKPSEIKTAPVVLSPVYETRTPSPTAIRRSDHFRQGSLNGVLVATNGDGLAGHPLPNGKVHEPVPPTPLDRGSGSDERPKQGNAQSSSGTWQTQSGTRKKNRKRTRSGPNPSRNAGGGNASASNGSASHDLKSKTDAVPITEHDRKGG